MDGRIERGPYGVQFVVDTHPDSIEIDYQMDILMQSRPVYLLPVYRRTTARGSQYVYPVTGLASLGGCLPPSGRNRRPAVSPVAEPADGQAAVRRIDLRRAAHLIQQLRLDLDDLDGRLLSPEQVLLQPESLYLAPDGDRLLLVYRPFLPIDGISSVTELAEWLSGRVCRHRWQQRRWRKCIDDGASASANSQESTVPAGRQAVQGQASHRPGSSSALVPAIAAALPVLGALAALPAGLAQGIPFTLRSLRLPLLVMLLLSIPGLLLFLGHLSPHEADSEPAAAERACGDHVAGDRAAVAGVRSDRTAGAGISSDSGAKPKPFKVLLARLNPLPLAGRALETIRRTSAGRSASEERQHEMPTQLLSSRQELFRLATLSEGMIGSSAETAGQRAFILNDDFVIGRDFRTADLCLTGYAVGRQHARITRQGAAFFITDLGSKNGTRLNGERLNKLEAHLLPDRCQLQFADRLFYFEAEALPIGA